MIVDDMLKYNLVTFFTLVSILLVLHIFLAEGCLNIKAKPSSTQNPSISGNSVSQPVTTPSSPSNNSGGSLQSSSGNRSGSQTSTYGAYALWTGKWDTTFFKHGGKEHKTLWELKQVESKVTGIYDWDNGKLGFLQSKTPGLMYGTWSEAPTYQPPDDSGDIEVQQSQDGNSFTGKWRDGTTDIWIGEWNGRRIE
jgi:hypothetical protein